MSTAGDFQDASTDYGSLTQQQAENIADLAARRAEERLYKSVGRTVLSKTVLALGAASAAIIAWLSGWVHLGPPK